MEIAAVRSWLFVPGSRADRFDKAVASGADTVILDLEDAVAPDGKDAARGAVSTWLSGGGRAWVRVNATGTAEHDADLLALAGPGLLGVVLPKVQSVDDIGSVTRAVPGVAVVALLESAVGLLRVHEVAAAPGVARLAFGSFDYAVDLGCEHEDDALLLARSTLVLASRAAGLPGPVDGVTTGYAEEAAVRADAARARRLGLTGKLVIHPRQLAAVHEGLAPAPEQLRWAREVLAAAGDEQGALAVDGALVDAPVLARARALLSQAR